MKRQSVGFLLKQTVFAVPAMALMLGAAHGSQVGINFQDNYNGNSYATLVAPSAFGVPLDHWFNAPSILNSKSHPISTNAVWALPDGSSLGVAWSANNTYSVSAAIPSGGNDQVIYGWLDDGGSGCSVTLTGFRNFASSYTITTIASTATGSASFSDVQVAYDSGTDVLNYTNNFSVTYATGTWGTSTVSSVITTLTGNNSVTLTSSARSGSTRGSLAGILIQYTPGGSNPPEVETQPQSPVGIIYTGQPFSLSALASGTSTLRYQWRQNGVPIVGATNSSYTSSGIPNAGIYAYDLVVTNNYGTVTSQAALVTISQAWLWKGNVNSAWDISGTANWTTNGAATTYLDGNPVAFNDTAVSTSVNVTTTVSPADMIVNNNTASYTIGGSPISGTASLSKGGTNTLTLSGVNSFTGLLAINAGSVTIGGAGQLGGGDYSANITNNGALNYSSSADQLLSGAVSGIGALTQKGPGTLTLAGTPAYTGNTTIYSNRLVLADTAVRSYASPGTAISLDGILEWSLSTSYSLGSATLNLSGAGVVQKTGPGSLTIGNPAAVTLTQSAGGAFDVEAGDLNIGFSHGFMAANSGGLYVASGATYHNSDTVVQADWLAGAGNINNAYSTTTPTLTIGGAGTANNAVYGVTNNTATFDGIIGYTENYNGVPVGTLNFVKTGSGTQILDGINGWTGTTTINGGALLVNSPGSLAATSVTVQNGARLGGDGILNGTVQVQSGGTLTAGNDSGIGNLTLMSTLTLNAGSTNRMRISKNGGTPASDMVSVSGVTLGGTLVVVNITSDASLLGVGDTFHLFNSGAGGSFSGFILPALAGGLSWDVSQLAASGNISVVNYAATPTFNPPAGGYIGAQTVTISTVTPSATIYFTTNSWASSNVYSGPIAVPVNTSVTFQAFVRATGFSDSPAVTAAYATEAQAVWLNTSGGSWSTLGNWTNNIPANGSSGTALFNALTLPADGNVTLDGSWIIGHLVFGDRGNTYNWIVTPGAGGSIQLQATTPPTIQVDNQGTIMQAALQGSSGLTKTGPGQLIMTGINSYSGLTTISQGTLTISNLNALPTTSDIVLGDANSGSTTPTFGISVNNISLNNMTVGANVTNATFFAIPTGNGFLSASNITLNSPLILRKNNSAAGWIGFQTLGGKITGPGAGPGKDSLILVNDGGFQAYFQGNYIPNDFLGNVHVVSGDWRIQNGVLTGGGGNYTFPDTASVTVDSGAILNFSSGGLPESIDGLNGGGIVSRNVNDSSAFTVGASGGGGNFSGVIQNGSGTFALTKVGSGNQILSGTNTYSGPTIISNGTLTVSGRLAGATAVTVNDGATLNVIGHGALPTIAGPGNLTLGSTILGFDYLSSTNVAPINAANVSANGSVTVNIGTHLAVGQFSLIKYSNSGSGLGNFVLGTLPPGTTATLVNNVGNKSLDLNVTVTSGPATIIADLDGGTNYLYAGRAYNLSVVAGGGAPLHYQWQKNGVTIPGAANTAMFSLASVTTGDSGGYSVTVTNASGSTQSSTSHLVVLPASGYTSQLASYWPLNEPSGTTALDLAGTNNATYSGAVTLGVPGIATGDSDTAVSFGGGTADAGYSDNLNPSTFTLEFWAKPADTAVAYVVALQDRTTGSRIGYAIEKNNFSSGWDFTFGNGPASYNNISSSTPVVAGKAYFVAATYDGTTAKLYVNGVLEASLATTYQPATPGAVNFTMGSRNGNSTYNGVLEDVRFYSRALAPGEISALAAAGPPPVTTVNTNPTNLTFSVTGNTLTLSWPSDHLGWHLQYQTNSLTTGLNNNWTIIPGSDTITSTNITINPAEPTVFYRLTYP